MNPKRDDFAAGGDQLLLLKRFHPFRGASKAVRAMNPKRGAFTAGGESAQPCPDWRHAAQLFGRPLKTSLSR